jgi:type II secretory pathway component PulF
MNDLPGATLPLVTKILLWVSHLITDYWFIVLPAAVDWWNSIRAMVQD